MNDLTPTPSKMQSVGYSAQAELLAELAKMLALVAPSSMTAEQQEVWLRAGIDALEDIRADEVRAVSAEVRRSATRHNQIIPEIAKLVSERRKRTVTNEGERRCPCGAGIQTTDRRDIHWVKRDGRSEIEWCGPPSGRV